MPIYGSGLKPLNLRLRMLMIIFMGVLAFGVVMYWRSTLMEPTYYSSIQPQKKSSNSELRSQNYQIEVQDSSPTVK